MLWFEGFVLEGVDVEVIEGIVLLMGMVLCEDDKQMVECLIWFFVVVCVVVNEIQVGEVVGFCDCMCDVWIIQCVWV